MKPPIQLTPAAPLVPRPPSHPPPVSMRPFPVIPPAPGTSISASMDEVPPVSVVPPFPLVPPSPALPPPPADVMLFATAPQQVTEPISSLEDDAVWPGVGNETWHVTDMSFASIQPQVVYPLPSQQTPPMGLIIPPPGPALVSLSAPAAAPLQGQAPVSNRGVLVPPPAFAINSTTSHADLTSVLANANQMAAAHDFTKVAQGVSNALKTIADCQKELDEAAKGTASESPKGFHDAPPKGFHDAPAVSSGASAVVSAPVQTSAPASPASAQKMASLETPTSAQPSPPLQVPSDGSSQPDAQMSASSRRSKWDEGPSSTAAQGCTSPRKGRSRSSSSRRQRLKQPKHRSLSRSRSLHRIPSPSKKPHTTPPPRPPPRRPPSPAGVPRTDGSRCEVPQLEAQRQKPKRSRSRSDGWKKRLIRASPSPEPVKRVIYRASPSPEPAKRKKERSPSLKRRKGKDRRSSPTGPLSPPRKTKSKRKKEKERARSSSPSVKTKRQPVNEADRERPLSSDKTPLEKVREEAKSSTGQTAKAKPYIAEEAPESALTPKPMESSAALSKPVTLTEPPQRPAQPVTLKPLEPLQLQAPKPLAPLEPFPKNGTGPREPKDLYAARARDVSGASKAAKAPTKPKATIRGPVLEITNLPDLSSKAEPPAQYLLNIFNPTLAILPDYDQNHGEPVQRAWNPRSNLVLMEMQNPHLGLSAVRILQGLNLFGKDLRVRLLSSEEAAAAPAPP